MTRSNSRAHPFRTGQASSVWYHAQIYAPIRGGVSRRPVRRCGPAPDTSAVERRVTAGLTCRVAVSAIPSGRCEPSASVAGLGPGDCELMWGDDGTDDCLLKLAWWD